MKKIISFIIFIMIINNFVFSENINNYYIILYNKTKVTNEDNIMIHNYAKNLKGDTLIINVDACKDIFEIYDKLKDIYNNKKGNLSGIQIFGDSNDVPSFNIDDTIQKLDKITKLNDYKSDYFYSNFNNDSNKLKGFSIYKDFNDKLNVNLIPKWKVARLPLNSKEIAAFMKRYYDYKNKIKKINVPYINFFNSITNNNILDFPYFLKEIMDKEFHIINSNQYRLYETQLSLVQSKENITKDFSIDNIKAENKKGIAEFIFNSHGLSTCMVQSFFINENDTDIENSIINNSQAYSIENNDGIIDLQQDILDVDNVNNVLNKNYYTIFSQQCDIANNLNSNNLVYKMLNGKCIDAIAPSGPIWMEENVNSSLDNMKNNNLLYFVYNYMKYNSKGINRDDSYYLAKKDYVQSILNNLSNLNYQYGLYNVLSYQYLGLLSY